MSLGAKINLTIAAVTIAVLFVTFGIILSMEASSIKNATLQNSATIGSTLKSDIEHMFQEVHNQQTALQAVVDKLSSVEGVKYVKVTGADGYRIASTDYSEVGKKITAPDATPVAQVVREGKKIDVQDDHETFFNLEQYIPVQLYNQDDVLNVVAVIEVEVSTHSKGANDVLEARRLLEAISVNVEQGARSIIATRESGLERVQKITDEIKKFDFFHDFIVLDSKLNVIANTDGERGELLDDPQEYKQYREDVLFGKVREASYERPHEGYEVLVRVSPIELFSGDKTTTVGVLEVHVLTSSYKDKVTTLIYQMVVIGMLVTAVLVVTLAFILRLLVVRPIKKYVLVAQKVSEGDLTQRIENMSNDEIGRFGEVFNAMVSNLYELDRLKTDFITVAAHQLRTPLSSVNWALKLLLDSEVGPINEDQRGMLARGYETNSKMIKLVNDLLDVTRIEHGKFVYKFETNDFNQLLDALIKNSEFIVIAREHNVEFHLEKRGEIPVFAFDLDKLSMAIQNLVDNALKYTLPGGHVTVTAEQKGNYLELKVADTGVGIPKEDLPKMFSKFFRATNAVHLQTEGSGLGLVIAKSIVVRHGGQIEVDSIEGKGTTFTLTVPLLPELLPTDESIFPVDNSAV
ncbi:MAG: hypothetical protein A2481_03950 [Candidatus Yonathbacteria bacterium RIFOXYC2_FULL_47_9]|nr:MAG: hypothetical protein A2481_03950 [Candidatus Yonathbacteria bacterium RIFOXYC2_FULL_47_9]HAT68225.1 hypothetical protein [Candidatus Yonathbacteria bacterium]